MNILNLVLIIVSIFALIFGPVATKSRRKSWDYQMKKYFNGFLKQNKREYLQNLTEYRMRFDIFKKSLYKIKTLNQRRQHQKSAIYGLTPFADITETEFETMYLTNVTNSERVPKPNQQHFEIRRHFSTLPSYRLASKIDWREKGIISPVHYQGKIIVIRLEEFIGDFNLVESVKALQTNSSVVELSVQQMIDCAKNHNFGCDGGDTCMLLEWLTSGHVAIERRSVYPDRVENEIHVCKNISSPVDWLAFVRSYSCENLAGHEDKLLHYLNSGPVTAALSALNWQFYVGGVIQFHCDAGDSSRNHAVQIVGYDLTAEIPHYILRNSWGIRFGNSGYVKIAIGQNMCGIANQVSRINVE